MAQTYYSRTKNVIEWVCEHASFIYFKVTVLLHIGIALEPEAISRLFGKKEKFTQDGGAWQKHKKLR